MKSVLLFGPQGSGKGTQGKLLADEYNLLNISAGDIIRYQIKNNKKNKKEIEEIVSNGSLIPDNLIKEYIKDFLKKNNLRNGIIFDGYPRNLNQAFDLEEILRELNIELYKVLYLKISKEELYKRLSGRLICPVCGNIYNIYTKPPLKENICDNDCAELIKRNDDKDSSINKRLEEYYNTTIKLLDFYSKKDIVSEIDATLDIKEVFSKIKEAMNDRI